MPADSEIFVGGVARAAAARVAKQAQTAADGKSLQDNIF